MAPHSWNGFFLPTQVLFRRLRQRELIVALVLLGVGFALLIFGAVVLLKYSDRPGGRVRIASWEVDSLGAGLPLIVIGVLVVALAAVQWPQARTPEVSPSPTESPSPTDSPTPPAPPTAADDDQDGENSRVPIPPPPPPPAPIPIPEPPPPPPPGPVAGQWAAPPSGLENHCMPTQTAGPNLHFQICWSGTTPMVVATVSGVTGQSPNHSVAVPRVWTVANGVESPGTTCPLKTLTIRQKFVCVDQTGPFGPGMTVESHARFQHDGLETSLFTPRI